PSNPGYDPLAPLAPHDPFAPAPSGGGADPFGAWPGIAGGAGGLQPLGSVDEQLVPLSPIDADPLGQPIPSAPHLAGAAPFPGGPMNPAAGFAGPAGGFPAGGAGPAPQLANPYPVVRSAPPTGPRLRYISLEAVDRLFLERAMMAASGRPTMPLPGGQTVSAAVAANAWNQMQQATGGAAYAGAPYAGAPYAGQVVQPIDPKARAARFASMLFIVRFIFVALGGVVLLMLAFGMTYNSPKDVNPDTTQWLDTAADTAAQPQIPELKKQIEQLEKERAQIDAKTKLPISLTGPRVIPTDMQTPEVQYLARLDQAFTSHILTVPHIREIAALAKTEEQREAVQFHLRSLMNGGHLGTQPALISVVELVQTVADDKTKKHFYDNFPTGADLPQFYRFSPIDLPKLLPLVPEDFRDTLITRFAESARVSGFFIDNYRALKFDFKKLRHLVFDGTSTYQSLLKELDNDTLIETAIEALGRDLRSSYAAAQWLLSVKPVDAHRARVLAALEPVLWISGDQQLYPATVAYLRWSGPENLETVASLIRRPVPQFALPDLAKALARKPNPYLDEFISLQLTNTNFCHGIRGDLAKEPVLVQACLAALTRVEPDRSQEQMVEALLLPRGMDDYQWLKDYFARFPEEKRQSQIGYYNELDRKLKQIEKNRKK
ncbi:MAG TPA: hypothetical protein PLV92_03125, partial [Pirellulaceae bacterium]|nr:hypothetical protein [Pirellulaceae bacterium]